MAINNWKLSKSENDAEDDFMDFPGDIPEIRNYETKTMKNIFIDTKTKKINFTKENVNKIGFANVNDLMRMENGTDGYLGAYSDSEFYAYRFQKLHNFYPDLVRIRFLKTEKFITEFFKYAEIPHNSYYKSYEDQRGEVHINIILLAIETGRKDKLYMYLDSDEVMFFYNPMDEKNPDSALNILIGLLKGCVEPKQQKNKIYVVYQAQHGFEKTGFDVKKVKVDLNENYNHDFKQISADIILGLNDKNKTNLVILEGPPGTGKTTYIRYLTSKLKKNIIFLPPDMVTSITDPSFIPFLIKNNNAILIIEDAEPALKSRDGNRSGAVSNVLNLTDGLLSDCLNISIIATFNTKEENIDAALLRKGRLLKHYKFNKLSIEKSKALLKKLGREDIKVSEPMTLSDIYYAEDNNSDKLKPKKIGFGN